MSSSSVRAQDKIYLLDNVYPRRQQHPLSQQTSLSYSPFANPRHLTRMAKPIQYHICMQQRQLLQFSVCHQPKIFRSREYLDSIAWGKEEDWKVSLPKLSRRPSSAAVNNGHKCDISIFSWDECHFGRMGVWLAATRHIGHVFLFERTTRWGDTSPNSYSHR